MQYSTFLKFSLVAGFLVLSAGLYGSVFLAGLGITWMLIVSAVACACSKSRIRYFDDSETEALSRSSPDTHSRRLSPG